MQGDGQHGHWCMALNNLQTKLPRASSARIATPRQQLAKGEKRSKWPGTNGRDPA
jgi:hypothetical protein